MGNTIGLSRGLLLLVLVFFLLAGVGVGVAMQRGRSAGEMSRYLLTRGLWLLILELVITPAR